MLRTGKDLQSGNTKKKIPIKMKHHILSLLEKREVEVCCGLEFRCGILCL